MNEDILKGKWNQVKGEARKQWGKLTNDDLDIISGEKDKLIGKIQERHGHNKDEAERQYKDWVDNWKDGPNS